jgi:predicted TPR repeat methyltransferase
MQSRDPATIENARLLLAQGSDAAAEMCCLQLLAARPDHVDALHLLGILRLNQRRTAEAMQALRRAIELAPRHAPAWNTMGKLMLATRNELAAEFAFMRSTEIDPGLEEAWTNLNSLLSGQRDPDKAVARFFKVLESNPHQTRAYYSLGLMLQRMGRLDLAAEVYRRWHVADPGDPVARHMLAAHSPGAPPPRATEAYITKIFDDFADDFDQKLGLVQYAGPRLLIGALTQAMGSRSVNATLDAGCGTGLCGPLLRPLTATLAGVDLSPRMLAHARQRGLYDQLHEAELVGFMTAHARLFDVVTCADTLEYFGNLADVMGAAAVTLQPGGVLGFTVEAEGAGSDRDYRLQPHGRYSHSDSYVRRCVEQAGFDVASMSTQILRKEAGVDVPAHIVISRLRA